MNGINQLAFSPTGYGYVDGKTCINRETRDDVAA
jgi:hypothetical protein